jgi:hypothetical protein
MKVALSFDVPDGALIAIGTAATGTVKRATRDEARSWLTDKVTALITDQELLVKRVSAQLLEQGLEVVDAELTG